MHMIKKFEQPTVYAIGECMIEFSRTKDGSFQRSFAGDVYNTAVYLKRLAPAGVTVAFVSAVGEDKISGEMLTFWQGEGISVDHVARLPGKSPGLYVVDTDEQGERNFSYWRSRSAARKLMDAVGGIAIEDLSEKDIVYFSGITLQFSARRIERRCSHFFKMRKKRAPSSHSTLITDRPYGKAAIVLPPIQWPLMACLIWF
ncbi:hypothetical protein JCM17844_21370 [Iodidimonas gelatinilytica]|uniref:Carbohydrate kinase PfkB domain-containing protein n=2 Tax=Iodidimonas gelatinilytica TaxID=1236966 RepID=A0A5A7MR37_9PROT|nr:hypothetical protein JCM17844_21370 [Iodidimonas gelatinilytica]